MLATWAYTPQYSEKLLEPAGLGYLRLSFGRIRGAIGGASTHTQSIFNEQVHQEYAHPGEALLMTTMSTRNLIKSGIAAAVLALSIPTTGLAQANGPTWLRFQNTRVRPEMRLEYEGYMKQIAAAYKKTSVLFFITTENVAGDMTE